MRKICSFTTGETATDTPTTSASYYLRSSVTGNVIREYDYSGALVKSNVFIGNQMIAQQSVSTGSTQMLWLHKNPVTGDTVSTDSVGHTMDIVRMDPTGVGMGDSDPSSTPQAGFGEVAGQDTSQPSMSSKMAEFFPSGGSSPSCTVDGMLTGCALVNTILGADAGTQCPENDCGIHYNPRDIDGNGTIDTYWDSFQSFADGHSGYGPVVGAIYAGDGHFTLPGTGPQGRPPTFAPRQANNHGATKPHGPNADPEADDGLLGDDGLRNFTKAEWDAYVRAKDLALAALSNPDCANAVRKGVIDKSLPGNGDPRAVLNNQFESGQYNFERYPEKFDFNFRGYPIEEKPLIYNPHRALEVDTTSDALASSGRGENPNGYTRFGLAFFESGLGRGLQFPSGSPPLNVKMDDDISRALVILHETRVIIENKSYHDDNVYNSEIYNACFKSKPIEGHAQ